MRLTCIKKHKCPIGSAKQSQTDSFTKISNRFKSCAHDLDVPSILISISPRIFVFLFSDTSRHFVPRNPIPARASPDIELLWTPNHQKKHYPKPRMVLKGYFGFLSIRAMIQSQWTCKSNFYWAITCRKFVKGEHGLHSPVLFDRSTMGICVCHDRRSTLRLPGFWLANLYISKLWPR